ncbi:MAG: AAA family ATPase [Mariniphaga sp.]|nr:AAA family ATPase [Mariniphaga sp.]
MIPIQLSLKGLYSYQEKQTIDFTRLTSAGLFGIFGTVGSGKSSILEAITFAIYGRTDRLNLSGDNRYYNMMNLKSNELLIDFIFETGREQTAYRATVKGRRNAKNFEDVKTLERSTYQKVNKEWIPVESQVLEQAVGLGYDNFKRTIIIPQGRFQEFLQLGNKDRTQMMKDLFHLEKFEFFSKVASLESKNNARKQITEGQLQQLGDINPEQLNVYRAKLIELDEELKGHNGKLAGNLKKEEQLRKLKELTLKKDEAGEVWNKLRQSEPLFQTLEGKIIRYEQCVIRFKNLLDALQENYKKRAAREKQIRLDRERLKTEELEMERIGKILDRMKPAWEKRDGLKNKAEELTRLIKMKGLEEAITKEEDRLKKGTACWNKTAQELDKWKTEKQQLEGIMKRKRGIIPDLTLLSTIRSWYINKNYLDKQLVDLEKEMEKFVQQEEEIQKEVAQIMTNPVFENLQEKTGYNTWVQYLKEKTAKIKEQQKALVEQESHFRVKAQLNAYAEELEDGIPCPLCGSLHHPELFKSEDIREELERLHANQKTLEQQSEQLVSLGNRLNFLFHQQQSFQHSHQELKDKKKEQQQKMADHASLFVWEKFRDEKELNDAFKGAQQIQEELNRDEKVLEDLSKKQQLEEKNRERYLVELEKIKTSLTEQRTEYKTIGQQLQLVQVEQYRQISVSLIHEERNMLLKEYDQMEKVFDENTRLLQERTKQMDTLNATLAANSRELDQEKLTIDKLSNRLDEELGKSPFRSVEEVSLILSEPIDVDAEKQKLARFKEQLLQSKSLLEQIQNEMGERVYDAELHANLRRELDLLKEQITQKNKEQGKTAELLEKLQYDLNARALLQKKMELLEVRAENIKTMKSLFKASGFVNYVSSVYLQNLCNAANDRFFQMTRQQLSLEITPDNNFQVRDFLNGGKVRSVKTLSGGQTFQAALSLALALADNIQKITESNQNFFFLDEGFGSLDKESLGIVFDTLKTLRKENRIVGVISHVEDMQQEIDVHLRIENHEEKGSVIYSSWTE